MTFKPARFLAPKLVDMPQEFMDNLELSKAMELVQESAYTIAELDAYDKYWDAVRVEKALTKEAFQQGIEQGIELGKTAGRNEATTAMIKSLLKEGTSIDMLVKICGLTKEQIEKL